VSGINKPIVVVVILFGSIKPGTTNDKVVVVDVESGIISTITGPRPINVVVVVEVVTTMLAIQRQLTVPPSSAINLHSCPKAQAPSHCGYVNEQGFERLIPGIKPNVVVVVVDIPGIVIPGIVILGIRPPKVVVVVGRHLQVPINPPGPGLYKHFLPGGHPFSSQPA